MEARLHAGRSDVLLHRQFSSCYQIVDDGDVQTVSATTGTVLSFQPSAIRLDMAVNGNHSEAYCRLSREALPREIAVKASAAACWT
jgi:hypothetical protein